MSVASGVGRSRVGTRAAWTGLGALVAGTVIGAALTRSPTAAAVAFTVAPVALLSFVLPLRFLLPATLLAVVLLPLDQVGDPTWLRHVPIAAIPLGALLLRAPIVRPLPHLRALVAVALAGWLALSFVLMPAAGDGVVRSAAWTVVVVTCVSLVAATPRRLPGRDASELAAIAIVTALAVLAVVEARVLHANPLFGELYTSGDSPILQKWGAYRATTSLGHPLVNGVVFASGLTLAAGRALSDERLRVPLGVAAACMALGVLATQSRTALAAAAFGLALLLFSRQSGGGRVRLAKIGLAAVMVIGGVVAIQATAARLGTTEAERSASDRLALPGLVADAMRLTGSTGAGPAQGADLVTREDLQSATKSQRLESGLAEWLVGTGWVGAALFYGLIALVVLAALRSPPHAAAGAALAAFAVATSGFNAFEPHAKLLVFLGFLVVLATARPPASPRRTERR